MNGKELTDMKMVFPPAYKINQKVLAVSDNAGYYHGIKDGREVKIMKITPLPDIQECP